MLAKYSTVELEIVAEVAFPRYSYNAGSAGVVGGTVYPACDVCVC
jgi:hypothetical protein